MSKNSKYLLSMTGFGRGLAEGECGQVLCEIRSVNYRGLDAKFRLPRSLHAQESEYQKAVQAKFTRGRVEVFVEFTPRGAQQHVQFNAQAASEILAHLRAFQKAQGLETQVSIGDLLRFRELLTFGDIEADQENLAVLASKALSHAIEDALAARQEEGERLAKIVASSLKECERLVKGISKHLVASSHKHFKELQKRIKDLVGAVELDDMRMAQEVAHIAERADVAEEINRLGAHIAHFRSLCQEGGALGRKLDFLCQEMFREANTASSKIAEATITYLVVDLKSEIERIREQVQNIE